MNDSEVKTMVRCLIGNGTEQEKIAVVRWLGRQAMKLVTKPGKKMVATKGTLKGQTVRGPRQFATGRALTLGFGVVPGVMAGVQAAKSHPKAHRMNPGQLP